MKNIILIKLGGSIITDKQKIKSANLEKIKQLSQEIYQAQSQTKDLIILGHGGGSFPHPIAQQYQTHQGLVNQESLIGLSKVRQACLELNLIVVSQLMAVGLPAVSLAPFNFMTTSKKQPDQMFMEPLLNILKFNLLPVVFGDATSDKTLGCTIYSTESILNIWAKLLPKYGYKAKLVIEVGKTAGVYDENGKTIEKINQNNFSQIKKLLSGSESTDVTGGMLHKVTQAYDLAKLNIPTLIISSKKGNLTDAILGKNILGTKILPGRSS